MAGCAMEADTLAECSSKKSMVWGLPSSPLEKSDLGRAETEAPSLLSTTTSTRTWRVVVRKTGVLGKSAEGVTGPLEMGGAGFDSTAPDGCATEAFTEFAAEPTEGAGCELLGERDSALVVVATGEALASSLCCEPLPFGVGGG